VTAASAAIASPGYGTANIDNRIIYRLEFKCLAICWIEDSLKGLILSAAALYIPR
jgi:hypothetical protein